MTTPVQDYTEHTIAATTRRADVARLRSDFPILHRQVRGKPLVYLDNAATTQKPDVVIDAVDAYYRRQNANVHRGLYMLSEQATDAFEAVRESAARFLNARDSSEIIFTSGTTGGINLVAAAFGSAQVRAGDEILISAMEHHSNIVPWQLLCERTGAVLRIIPITDDGELRLDAYTKLLSDRTRMVAIVHVSNALGTVNPIKQMIACARECNIPVLVDGAQSVAHMAVDVQDLDCDFFVLSGHKLFGPTGVGVLYGKAQHLEAMPPYQGGGDMIRSVTFEKTRYNKPPQKFEAGTPNIAGVIGLGAAIDYLRGLEWEAIGAYEHDLLTYATEKLAAIERVHLIGTAPHKTGVLSFVIDGIHPHDIGTILDFDGIAIRAGHHCTQPLMDRLGLSATARASFSFYNTREEVDLLATAIPKIFEVMG